MPRPKSLAPSAVAEAALALIEQEGLDNLSMRALAQRLGMGVMSLYRYVEGRGALETAVVDLVLADLDLTLPEFGPWADKAALLASRLRAAAAGHPRAIPLLLARRHQSANALRWSETLLTVLADAGFVGERRIVAFRTLTAYVFGALPGADRGEPPTDALPRLAEAANAETDEAAFLAGLGLVLRGIRTG